jgi:hypothetical protein
MKSPKIRHGLLLGLLVGSTVACTTGNVHVTPGDDSPIGRVEVSTLPVDPALRLRTATYTPSGKVLIAYNKGATDDRRYLNLAVMDDDGTDMYPFFSQRIPDREKDNGIRFMVFPDNQRIFLGDFIIECVPDLDTCKQSTLLPVEYPSEIASGDTVSHRWSEMIIAPDNEHIAWTTLLANYSAVVFTGKLAKDGSSYTIVNPRIISTLDAFTADPQHPDGVLPNPVRNGEVKQFVEGGSAISMVGAKRRDTADSVVQHLPGGDIEQITNTPGYNETTIFSPDERLGITMSTRFSDTTDMAILGLIPRPYPASLNMGLNMHTYTYSVVGVRQSRSGNIGPALIDIEHSKTDPDYRGINLNTEDEWVYHSPMSWHPDGKRAMWLEGQRGESRREGGSLRAQLVHLLDYQPGPTVVAGITPDDIPYAITDLSVIGDFLRQGKAVDVKVYGRASGYIEYRRNATGLIEKNYADFSDDGEAVFSGSEKIQINPGGFSTYTADVTLSGPNPGVMDLKITFGPLQDALPARLVFSADEDGKPLTYGYTEFAGQRLDIKALVQ